MPDHLLKPKELHHCIVLGDNVTSTEDYQMVIKLCGKVVCDVILTPEQHQEMRRILGMLLQAHTREVRREVDGLIKPIRSMDGTDFEDALIDGNNTAIEKVLSLPSLQLSDEAQTKPSCDRKLCAEAVFRGKHICNGEIGVQGKSYKITCPCVCHAGLEEANGTKHE